MRERINLKRGLLISYNIKRQTDKAKNQGYSTVLFHGSYYWCGCSVTENLPKIGSDKVKPLFAGTFDESYILDMLMLGSGTYGIQMDTLSSLSHASVCSWAVFVMQQHVLSCRGSNVMKSAPLPLGRFVLALWFGLVWSLLWFLCRFSFLLTQ